MNIEKEQEQRELPKAILLYPKELINVQLTQEQLELLLQNYEKELHKIDWKGFIEIFALFIGILITIMTADFRDFVGLSGETIRGFFLMAAIVSGSFSVYFLGRNIKYSCFNRPKSAHSLIEKTVNDMRVQIDEAMKEEYANFKPSTFGGTEEDKEKT